MNQISIKILEPAQWAVLKEIRLKALTSNPEAFKLNAYDKESQYSDEEWLEKASDPKRFYLIAYDQNKPIGIIGASYNKIEPNSFIIMGVFVEEQYRNKGIAKKMMLTAIEMIKAINGIDKIKLWVHHGQEAAKNMYVGLGFKEQGEETYGGGHASAIVMELFLK